jgi:hypothetical protein
LSGNVGSRLTALMSLSDLFVAAIEASFAMIQSRSGPD